MRYIFYGAGAIGGVIGAKLHMAGQEVLLIARGEHLRAMRERGLEFRTPGGTHQLNIPTVGHPSEIEFRPEDVVLLSMKSQDTGAALTALRAAAGDQIPVVCCQNGVENERLAARLFANVYGVMIVLPATYLDPGVVETPVWPLSGITDVGRYPHGVDRLAGTVSQAFSSSNLISRTTEDIQAWKYAKLIQNLNNAVQAVCGREQDTSDLAAQVRAEAEACISAAGIACISREEFNERNSVFSRDRLPPGATVRSGSSTWQSLERGSGSIEVDYLNGEVSLLGHLHGMPAPANEVFQLLADRMAREHMAPGAISPDQARQLIRQRSAVAAGGEAGA
jgi:2-dehydropantoate 2-reductase